MDHRGKNHTVLQRWSEYQRDGCEDSPGKGYFCPERRTVIGESRGLCSEIICSVLPQKMKPRGKRNPSDNNDRIQWKGKNTLFPAFTPKLILPALFCFF
jgi:hypothetical protein